ncbi:hypothetical protein EXIGLDRAFT_453626 [Exidia glandulosa HHB12029]|uniref:Uncharacterized protein n=1 Tax=Exidia glandulosa HHB12029 TaxID=1314781 RepID=A0A165B2T4_EXIGL|nr:hypothetical protein EXIGLDRAFT_453626 [Exidia glandulosa HHB12029]
MSYTRRFLTTGQSTGVTVLSCSLARCIACVNSLRHVSSVRSGFMLSRALSLVLHLS